MTSTQSGCCHCLSPMEQNITLQHFIVKSLTAKLRRFSHGITGHGAILCDPAFEFGAKYDEGVIMSCEHKLESIVHGAEIDEYPKLMDLFNFVDYDGQDFKAWYVDVSHRVRHNTAKAYTLNFDGNIISSGILSSIYDGYGVLTAVRTADEFRRMGYGGQLVKYICSDVKNAVYIMREQNLNEHFYRLRLR